MMICGVDEAGRGPLAGPVAAAAVILPPDFPSGILDDSKALSPERREEAARLIRGRALAWSTGWAWPDEIDRLNIHHATLLAMARALEALPGDPDEVLVDGRFTPSARWPCRAIVRGDGSIPSIMAASIIAKTSRDGWMRAYALIEPAWGFEVHKGYPTESHRERIRIHGLSVIHRRSFRCSFP
jgi:ribonuclease HII